MKVLKVKDVIQLIEYETQVSDYGKDYGYG